MGIKGLTSICFFPVRFSVEFNMKWTEFLFVCWGVCSLVTSHFQAIMLIDENSWHVYQIFSLVSSTLDLERKGVAHMPMFTVCLVPINFIY